LLTLNSLMLNSLMLNLLTLNSLTLNLLTLNALHDPAARDVFKYIVSCALPADESINLKIQGVSYAFPGELGLAPEWGANGGHCDEACQQWVSGCVISRLDYLGQPTLISIRGENPGLKASASEQSTYTNREATYYGNIFTPKMQIHACLSPGKTQDPRVCGPSIATCGVDVVGSCDQVCGKPRADGSFPNCAAPDADDVGHKKADHDDVYHGSVTVFLKP
jgi:hypothetical protein